MKARICYTIQIDDEFRLALNYFDHRFGLATRKHVKDHLIRYGTSSMQYIIQTYRDRQLDIALVKEGDKKQ